MPGCAAAVLPPRPSLTGICTRVFSRYGPTFRHLMSRAHPGDLGLAPMPTMHVQTRLVRMIVHIRDDRTSLSLCSFSPIPPHPPRPPPARPPCPAGASSSDLGAFILRFSFCRFAFRSKNIIQQIVPRVWRYYLSGYEIRAAVTISPQACRTTRLALGPVKWTGETAARLRSCCLQTPF